MLLLLLVDPRRPFSPSAPRSQRAMAAPPLHARRRLYGLPAAVALAKSIVLVQIWWRFAFAYTAPMFAQTLFRKRCTSWLLATGIFLMLSSCAEPPSEIERIQEEGVLRWLTRKKPPT